MLEARNIQKIYKSGNKELAVLKGVDVKIDQGKFVAIVGPSGAGKSTLLHILGGLDAPTEGVVSFEGEDLYNLSDIALSEIRNRRIGFVFQFYHLLSEFTVVENILMPAWIGGGYSLKCQLKEEVTRLLERVGLSERAQHFPSQLSGGEQQRVAILRALINRPRLLLCDEPTGNLDSGRGEEILNLIKKINTENQMAVVLVTHNLELTRGADRVYHLKDGILVN